MLERECSVFSRYLAGREPSRYVRDKYIDYHRRKQSFEDAAAFEKKLVRLAALHPWLTRVADAYAARLDRCSVLRKKLSLLAAIMECTPDYSVRIDSAYRGPVAWIFLRMGLAVAASALALAASLILVLPLRAALDRRPRR